MRYFSFKILNNLQFLCLILFINIFTEDGKINNNAPTEYVGLDRFEARKKILNDDCDDTGCSLKVFNKKIFLKFPLFNGIHRFLPALFKGYGHKTKFINVGHPNRKHGYSKYNTTGRLFRGIKDMITVKNIIRKY